MAADDPILLRDGNRRVRARLGVHEDGGVALGGDVIAGDVDTTPGKGDA